MLRQTITLLAATVLVAGCSSTGSSVARKPGTFTAINVPVHSDLWLDSVVQVATKKHRGCGELSKNLLPATADKDFSTDIEGDQDIFFHVSRADAQVECNKYGMFYATKGNEYTLKLETNNRQCQVSLVEKSPKGTQQKINTYPAHVSQANGVKVCANKSDLY